nr:class I SAM-dependent methyltransferase [Oceanobacillus limi]
MMRSYIMLQGILNYAHELLKECVHPNETVIDATCGNGNDTVFLSKLVGEHGLVLGFDIQEQAINNTKQKLKENNCDNVKLILDSHANADTYLSTDTEQSIAGAIFNLGYLPKSDKSIITQGHTTMTAINKILQRLKENGIIVLVIYHGHPGGKEEKDIILDKVSKLDQKKYTVLKHEFLNQANTPPFLVAIQKR